YRAGAIQPGPWRVVIDTHRINGIAPCDYWLDVELSTVVVGEAALGFADPAPTSREEEAQTSGARWYRGDLHAHTIHSDGDWDVPDLLTAARQFGLDFVTLTDHNTVAPLAQMDAATTPTLLTLGGLELTTFYGHALALGLRNWVDWRINGSERTMPQIADEVRAAGGLFVMAHPKSIGDPVCTGCRWMYLDMMPGNAGVVEIWNGGPWDSDSNNEAALALYYEWLNVGHRLVATAGTDVHGWFPAGVRPGFNVVYATARSEAALLQAIRAGHLFLSSGPHLELTVTGEDGEVAIMGDTVPAGSSDITATWSAAGEGEQLYLVLNGQRSARLPVASSGTQTWTLGADEARWCLVELRDRQNRVSAITNPIFFAA
ncbi:MAG: CehA/McbA family metallohydrolase, partial [Chloroflexota bacterium]|nr:CehA/McbA family metallohydrolase [Chloroflexota bacterium]